MRLVPETPVSTDPCPWHLLEARSSQGYALLRPFTHTSRTLCNRSIHSIGSRSSRQSHDILTKLHDGKRNAQIVPYNESMVVAHSCVIKGNTRISPSHWTKFMEYPPCPLGSNLKLSVESPNRPVIRRPQYLAVSTQKEQTKDAISKTFQLVHHFGGLSFLGCLDPRFQCL